MKSHRSKSWDTVDCLWAHFLLTCLLPSYAHHLKDLITLHEMCGMWRPNGPWFELHSAMFLMWDPGQVFKSSWSWGLLGDTNELIDTKLLSTQDRALQILEEYGNKRTRPLEKNESINEIHPLHNPKFFGKHFEIGKLIAKYPNLIQDWWEVRENWLAPLSYIQLRMNLACFKSQSFVTPEWVGNPRGGQSREGEDSQHGERAPSSQLSNN